MDNPMIRALEERGTQAFSPVNDDVFILILLACSFLLLLAFADDTCYFKQLVRNYSIGHSHQLSDEVRTSRAFYMRILLLLQACVSSSLCVGNGLFVSGAVSSRPDMLKALLFGFAGIIVWMVLKTLLYMLVNSLVFFSRQKNEWTQVYGDTFIMWGLASFAFAVVSTFFSMSFTTFSIIAITIVAAAEIWLSVKAFQIFFAKRYGGLQLLLYLCTLEWIPLLVLGKIFVKNVL